MKNRKRLLALCLCGAMALSLCACGVAGQPTGGGPSDPPSDALVPSADPDPGASPELEVDLTRDLLAFSAGLSAEDELLTVNGTGMGADLVLYWLGMSCGNFMSSYGMFGLNLSDYADVLRDDAVTLCTYNILLRQKAAQLGCLPTDAQVQEARENMMSGGQENYDLLKTAYGLTDDSMEYIFTVNAYYDNVLDALVPPADDEMLNNYVYHVKHILLLTVDMEGQPVQQEDGSYAYPSLDEETVAAKRSQAEDLLAQLRAADDLEAKFDELMNEYSEDSGLQSNPDGYTATPGQMVPEFETTAFSLGFGEISDIVESSYGYHIILRGEVEDLDGYADECRESLLDEQLDGLLESARVTRAPALDALDVADFYTRYTAYQQALKNHQGGVDNSSEATPTNSNPPLSKAEIASVIRSTLEDSGDVGDCEYVDSKNTFILYTRCPLTVSQVELVLQNGTSENWEGYKSNIEEICKAALKAYSSQGYSDVTCIVTLLDPDDEIMCTSTDGVLTYVHPSLK